MSKVLYEKDGRIGRITLNRPDMMNAIDNDLPGELAAAVAQADADPGVHVMILSGLGRDKVQQAFGSVPNLSLAVEHGFHYRIRNGPWEQLMPGVKTDWRDVAEAILFFASDRARMITGQRLLVNSGELMR